MTTNNLSNDAPLLCEWVIFKGGRHAPPEYCEGDCEPGELYCPAHAAWAWDDIGEPEDNWVRLELEDPWG